MLSFSRREVVVKKFDFLLGDVRTPLSLESDSEGEGMEFLRCIGVEVGYAPILPMRENRPRQVRIDVDRHLLVPN
jgi:hypothetical protein